MSQHGKVESFLPQGDDTPKFDERCKLNPAAGGELDSFGFQRRVVSNVDEEGDVDERSAGSCVERQSHDGASGGTKQFHRHNHQPPFSVE